MKFVAFILILFSTGSKLFCQNVTINQRDVSIKKILTEIRKQTGYYFGFTNGNIPKDARYTLIVRNIPLKEALDILFKGKPYTYVLMNHTILITSLKINNEQPIPVRLVLNGKVESELGVPIEGATVSIGGKGTITDASGEFFLTGFRKEDILEISSIAYEPQKIVINGKTDIHVKLKLALQGLDETVVIAYGKTSHRLNTGDVYKIKGSEIVEQPVSNFIAALPGRVPGMLISQHNGLPGTAYKAEVRGPASIGTGFDIIPDYNPLFIIDGVPFAPNNINLPTIASGSALGNEGRNSFDLINTNDIESIEILKDADATAIYGSRGAGGVILVTTKKGKSGKPLFNINFNTGLGKITRYPNMMNTTEYVKMRREAIMNDGNIPNAVSAPDLFKWDTTRYTDFKKLILGGTAKINNFHCSVSGGSSQTKYFLSSSLYKETTVFPGTFYDSRYSSHVNIDHRSKNSKFNGCASAVYTYDNNHSLARDLTTAVTLPPNAPALYDSSGNLTWQYGGLPFNNPMATLDQPYTAKTNNLLVDLAVSYKIINNLSLKINGGANNIRINESSLQPRKSLNTFAAPNVKGASYFASAKIRSWIFEPQVEYLSSLSKGKITILAGATLQHVNSRITNHAATGFDSDASLTDLTAAEKVSTTINNVDYKYFGVFGRVSYNWMDKYVLNLTGRRDGSSRFGPGRQFGNFGAVGAAWIFSNEVAIKKRVPFISFGKVRASYGVTGSDQIGDYKYLDGWQPSQYTYQGDTGLVPIQPANANYSWEENRKLEGGLELGFLNNQIIFSTIYYRNRTGNQLISVSVPSITGFNRIPAANSLAIVQNSGWEIGIQINKGIKSFKWNSNLVLTIPKNKLLVFPGLSTSPYVYRLIEGEPLSIFTAATYKGVNSSTGLFEFQDNDNDGIISYPSDFTALKNLAPKYYGSWLNNISFKNWQLNFLIEYKKQKSYNFLRKIYLNRPPGLSRSNQPSLLNDYWHEQGENSYIQKLTASTASPAYSEIDNFINSTGVISDASYIKFKMISISYNLPAPGLRKFHLNKCKLYIAANNLATITAFKATDPESIDIFTLPPLRTISAGMHISF